MTRLFKRNYISVLLLLLAVSGVHAVGGSRPADYQGQWPDSVFPIETLNGRVLTVQEKAYHVEFDGASINRHLKYSLVLKYDGKGRLTDENYFNADGSAANSISYEYDGMDLAVKIQDHPSVINPDRELFRIVDGRILEAEKIFSKGRYGWKYRNSYDDKGRIVLTSKYDRYWNWKLVYSRIFSYDDQGRLEYTEGFGMNSELLWRDEFEYDADGRVSVSRKFNPDGDLVVRIENSYNAEGLAARREFFDGGGRSYAIYTYAYNYDEKGNWIQKVIGREEPGIRMPFLNPDSMVVRTIEYSD